jgi:hypothetical protein
MHLRNNYGPFGKGLRIFSMGIIGLVTAIIFGLLFGYFVELLWNALMPSIFKITKITYWEAVGIVLLARLIFGSIGHDHGNSHSFHDRYQYQQKYHRWCKNQPDGMDGNDWEYYDAWWRAEGKVAFENYIAKVEHKSGDVE